MADKTVDGGPWTGCAVMFLQSLCPAVNLLALYKDQQEGKFIVFKVIKLTLIGKYRFAWYLGQLWHTEWLFRHPWQKISILCCVDYLPWKRCSYIGIKNILVTSESLQLNSDHASTFGLQCHLCCDLHLEIFTDGVFIFIWFSFSMLQFAHHYIHVRRCSLVWTNELKLCRVLAVIGDRLIFWYFFWVVLAN